VKTNKMKLKTTLKKTKMPIKK